MPNTYFHKKLTRFHENFHVHLRYPFQFRSFLLLGDVRFEFLWAVSDPKVCVRVLK